MAHPLTIGGLTVDSTPDTGPAEQVHPTGNPVGAGQERHPCCLLGAPGPQLGAPSTVFVAVGPPVTERTSHLFDGDAQLLDAVQAEGTEQGMQRDPDGRARQSITAEQVGDRRLLVVVQSAHGDLSDGRTVLEPAS